MPPKIKHHECPGPSVTPQRRLGVCSAAGQTQRNVILSPRSSVVQRCRCPVSSPQGPPTASKKPKGKRGAGAGRDQAGGRCRGAAPGQVLAWRRPRPRAGTALTVSLLGFLLAREAGCDFDFLRGHCQDKIRGFTRAPPAGAGAILGAPHRSQASGAGRLGVGGGGSPPRDQGLCWPPSTSGVGASRWAQGRGLRSSTFRGAAGKHPNPA